MHSLTMKYIGKEIISVHKNSGRSMPRSTDRKDISVDIYKRFARVKRVFTAENTASCTVNERNPESIFLASVAENTPQSI